MPRYRVAFYGCFLLVAGLLFLLNSQEMACIDWALMGIVQIHPTSMLDDFSYLMGFIGGPFVSLIFICMLSLGFLLLRQFKPLCLFLVLFAFLTGFEVVSKTYLDHPRPPAEFVRKIRPHGCLRRLPDLSLPSENSFPSGHSMRAIFLTAIAATLLGTRNKKGRIVVAVLVGAYWVGANFSRVYIGAHWPCDVIGGAALGAMGWITFLHLTSMPPLGEG